MPKYRLQTALNVRARQEKIRQKEFAQQAQNVQKLKDNLEAAHQSLQERGQELDQAKQEGFNIAQLQWHSQYRQRMQQEMKITQKHLKQQTDLMEVKRRNLVQATQKRRVLEILKDKHQQRFLKKQEHLERLVMDEIAQNMQFRNENA